MMRHLPAKMERQHTGSRLGRRSRKRKRRKICDQSDRIVSCAHDLGHINLQKWMTNQNGFKNNLVPALFPETGRGLMTKKAIKPGEIIVSLPHSLLITTRFALSSEIGQFIKRWIPKLSPQQCLSVFLIWEKNKHESSVWFPYIQVLPSSFTTPAYFSQTELTYLPKAVKFKALKECKKLEKSFHEVKEFSEKHWNEFHTILTFDVYRWAWYVINTRSVFYQSGQSEYLSTDEPDTLALAPFLDLLNHSPSANIKAGFNTSTNCYEISTSDTYKAYDQVFICYGCHSNEKLFLEYGFCVPGNCNDTVEVLYDDILKACYHFSIQHLSKKIALLQEHGLLKSLMCTNEGLSWNLLSVLKVLVMDWNQLQIWNQVYTNDEAFPDIIPAAKKLAHWILQQYMAENTQHMKHVEKIISNDDNPEHITIARQLISIERDILMTSLQ